MEAILYWRFRNDWIASRNQYPPEPLRLEYGQFPANSPFLSRDYETIHRCIFNGYETKPGDCAAVRAISRYGLLIRSPGLVKASLLPEKLKWPIFKENYAARDFIQISGTPSNGSDSEFLGSWIIGSKYIKVQTGIEIYFPLGYSLYQGPVPNEQLCDVTSVQGVMAGLEFFNKSRNCLINGQNYCRSDMNAIVQVPDEGELVINEGAPLQWVVLMPAHLSSVSLVDIGSQKLV